MNNLPILCLLLLFSNIVTSQKEFDKYEGYIYPQETMTNLRIISDSLNLKYQTCDVFRVYSSVIQAEGNLVFLSHEKYPEEIKYIKNNEMSFTDFKTRFPKIDFSENLPVILVDNKNDKPGKRLLVYKISGYTEDFDIGTTEEVQPDKMIVSEESNGMLVLFLNSELKSSILPKKYSDCLAYSHCMIDTTTSKMLGNNGEYDVTGFDIDKVKDAKKAPLLKEMRNTRVYGYCSMDNRPRVHARNIAVLSADLAEWQVFLKAHLDILNDNVGRVSDNSIAWASRGTYIGELEALNIDTYSLLMGTILRAENLPEHHYSSSFQRMGRAISESKNLETILLNLRESIIDKELDTMNRYLCYYLLRNVMYELEENTESEQFKLRLKEVQSLLN